MFKIIFFVLLYWLQLFQSYPVYKCWDQMLSLRDYNNHTCEIQHHTACGSARDLWIKQVHPEDDTGNGGGGEGK